MTMPFENSFQGRAEERIMRHLYAWAPLNCETIAYDLDMPLIDVRLCVSAMSARKWLDGSNARGYELSFRFAWMEELYGLPGQQELGLTED